MPLKETLLSLFFLSLAVYLWMVASNLVKKGMLLAKSFEKKDPRKFQETLLTFAIIGSWIFCIPYTIGAGFILKIIILSAGEILICIDSVANLTTYICITIAHISSAIIATKANKELDAQKNP